MSSLRKLITLGFLPVMLWAHGIEVVPINSAQALKAIYSDGAPMTWAEVSAYRPGSNEAFSNGYSDDNGCYAFVPDTAGTWRVVFNDGMGHGIDYSFVVNEDMLIESSPSIGRIPFLPKVISGLAVIFGITALLYVLTLRRRAVA